MYWFIFKSWIHCSFSRLNVFVSGGGGDSPAPAYHYVLLVPFLLMLNTFHAFFFFDVSVVNFEQVNVCFELIHLENWSTRTFKIRSWFSEKRTANCFYGLASIEILFFTRLNFFVVVITCFSSCFTDFSLEMN